MSRTKVGRGELEENIKEKNVRLETHCQMIEQLEGEGSTGDDGRAERQNH